MVALSLLSLYAMSTPWVSVALMGTLERQHPVLSLEQTKAPDAIVILGGGRNPDAPEFGGDTVSPPTLLRLRYGAYLQRHSQAPVLVSGGRVYGELASEADLMAQALAQDFNVPTRWREDRSRNTHENAKYSAELLLAEERKHIWLVTQAWHMPRSVVAYEAYGVEVTPAPTAFSRHSSAKSIWLRFLPRAKNLAKSSQAIHEWLGIAYYRVMAAVAVDAL
ncbi:YdcF family protein [Maricurvus nonylphenolicus]